MEYFIDISAFLYFCFLVFIPTSCNTTLIFYFSIFFTGVVPLSLVFIKAGTVLQELTDLGVTSLASFSTLIILAGLSLLPLVFRNQLREAFL